MRPPLRLPALLLAAAAACSAAPTATAPEPGEPELSILFVGNSLTYTHDLPGVVTTVAEALGRDVAVAMQAQPGFALEDHWHRGIAGTIRELSPDVVVMQQGPSSLPANQAHLAAWADSLGRVVGEVGAEPALLMVWPDLSRVFAFDDVRDGYRRAARTVNGTFIPAGEALRALHAGHPDLSPFGSDGFHPHQRGTVLAAYVVVGTLLDARVQGLPGRLPAGSRGGPPVVLEEAVARILQATADSVVARWRETDAAP